MTLDKAIEILTTELHTAELQTEPDFYNALQLAINCMGYVHLIKQYPHLINYPPLPQEEP